MSSFPDRFPHYACGIVSPLRLRWVKDVCVFRCNLPPAFWRNDRGFFTCHCGNTGVERTCNKIQHAKLTLKKKILPLLLPGFELATFLSRVRRSFNKLFRLSSTDCLAGVYLVTVQSGAEACCLCVRNGLESRCGCQRADGIKFAMYVNELPGT